MASAQKRIVLVTQNIQFAIDVKRALEAMGEFSVTTAVDARKAVEQIRDHPQHLLLLDTTDLSLEPGMLIEIVRSRQADIAIVLAPDTPRVHELARVHRAQGFVDIPVMARELIPLLDAALQERDEALPATQQAPAVDVGEDTIFIESLLDEALAEDLPLNYTRRRLQASYELLRPRGETESPAPPGAAVEVLVERVDEGDTVRFRYVAAADEDAADAARPTGEQSGETTISANARGETVQDLAHSISGDASQPAGAAVHAPANERHLDDSAAFRELLGAVLDESTQLENLTLESLFDTTRELPGALGTGVVPAWLRETEEFIREPGFLADMADSLPAIEALKENGETTVQAREEAPLDHFENQAPGAPVEAETTARMDAEAAAETELAANRSEDPAAAPLWRRNDDPLLAQLALTMTQMMTDLTADATVLARDNRIVAYSGEMPLERFRLLRQAVADDWTANDSQSRIRFVKLPEEKLDYMLYSRASVADHTLTMIFAGGRQLRDIRRQSNRMLSALDAAPHNDGHQARIDPPAPDAATDERQPFAFVWLVDDRSRQLKKPVAEQLVFWLEVQLNSMNWKIRRLDVHQDFIHLCADVPGGASPEALVRTVMDRARMIACSEDASLRGQLWADAYLVLQPGREMNEGELQRFLQFARA